METIEDDRLAGRIHGRMRSVSNVLARAHVEQAMRGGWRRS
jgi:hypothetical protein